MSLRVSIIVPIFNEGEGIKAFLQPLQAYRAVGHQVIVVDGGSRDESVALATPLADKVFLSPPGRALQMNAGVEVADGELLLFLHADTVLPENALLLLSRAIAEYDWGRFDVRLSGSHRLLRVIEWMMNWRSRLTGVATGDQAIFIRRELFIAVGGFPSQPLMEDVAMSKLLRKHGRPACIDTPLMTSSRRWEQRGVVRTILLMWRLRLLYWLGVDATKLARMYR